jgi:hypothetical protein
MTKKTRRKNQGDGDFERGTQQDKAHVIPPISLLGSTALSTRGLPRFYGTKSLEELISFKGMLRFIYFFLCKFSLPTQTISLACLNTKRRFILLVNPCRCQGLAFIRVLKKKGFEAPSVYTMSDKRLALSCKRHSDDNHGGRVVVPIPRISESFIIFLLFILEHRQDPPYSLVLRHLPS